MIAEEKWRNGLCEKYIDQYITIKYHWQIKIEKNDWL